MDRSCNFVGSVAGALGEYTSVMFELALVRRWKNQEDENQSAYCVLFDVVSMFLWNVCDALIA